MAVLYALCTSSDSQHYFCSLILIGVAIEAFLGVDSVLLIFIVKELCYWMVCHHRQAIF
jgi:hypothetical protein